jgi:hypothetical protein
MVVVMMVMPVRSERGTGNYSKQQGDKNPLLHGTNLARELRTWISEGCGCTTKPTSPVQGWGRTKKRKLQVR